MGEICILLYSFFLWTENHYSSMKLAENWRKHADVNALITVKSMNDYRQRFATKIDKVFGENSENYVFNLQPWYRNPDARIDFTAK